MKLNEISELSTKGRLLLKLLGQMIEQKVEVEVKINFVGKYVARWHHGILDNIILLPTRNPDGTATGNFEYKIAYRVLSTHGNSLDDVVLTRNRFEKLYLYKDKKSAETKWILSSSLPGEDDE